MRTICVVITARPSYSRIKTVMDAIIKHKELKLQLIVMGSALLDKYGSVVDFIEKDGFKINNKIHTIVEGQELTSMPKSTALGLLEITTVFENLRPDIVVTIADRYETIATAIAASYMNIPLAHIQGGEVTGSIDEKVRHAVTKLSNFHFASTKLAGKRIRKMGENPSDIYVTGCPSMDLTMEVVINHKLDFDPIVKYGGVGSEIDLTGDYIVVLQHPVTTEYDKAGKHVLETLQAVAKLNLPTIWLWPNIDAGSDDTSGEIRSFREEINPQNIYFMKNMSSVDFLKLLKNSSCIVGNSSVAIRECSFMGVPAINIGTRQQSRERGKNVINVNYSSIEIEEAILIQINNKKCKKDNIYGTGDAGEKIADILSRVDLKIEKRLTY